LFLRVVFEFDHFVDLLAYLLVLVVELVCLVGQLVHVVQERVVLLFRLDKAGHDLVNRRDSRRLLDLLERILDHLHVAQVLVHEPLFLPVSGYYLRESQLKDGQWVLKLPVLRFLFRWRRRLVVINLVFFLFLVQLLLVALDFSLEVVFILFVLGPESDRLVDLLLREALLEDSNPVLLHGLLVHLLGQLEQAVGLAVLVHNLSTQHVDLALKLLVLRLGLVQTELFVLDGVLLAVEADLVSLVRHRLGPDLADVFLFLRKLILDLLNLVLQNLQLPLFVFKLLRVNVHLALQPGRLTLVNRVVSAAHAAARN